MAEVNLRSWSEISQASEGLQLNSTAATLEHILARFARLEIRLVEHERRVAATLPPLQPEPDPPDATTFQQPHAAQLPRQYQQPQQPEMQDWRWQKHQPHTQPVQTRRPTSWDPPDYRQQSGFMLYDQYPLPYHHWEKNQPPPTPPCGWDPPAQRSLHGFPPHNQSHNLSLHSVLYGIASHVQQPRQQLRPTNSCWDPPQLHTTHSAYDQPLSGILPQTPAGIHRPITRRMITRWPIIHHLHGRCLAANLIRLLPLKSWDLWKKRWRQGNMIKNQKRKRIFELMGNW